jgi:hypothetical protein
MKILLLMTLLALATVLLVAGCGTSRAGYQTAPYRVVRTAGPFEIRDYPDLALVETPMALDGADSGFGRLFRFISGRNAAQTKIAMTTPVYMSGNDAERTMAFVMPSSLATAQVPAPADPALRVREAAAGRFAVLRFSGSRSPRHEAEALHRLRGWMLGAGVDGAASPVYGYFDPPWTPPFLRRNEVMLRLGAGTR